MKILETKNMQNNEKNLNYYYFDNIENFTKLLEIFKLMILQGLTINKLKVVFEADDSYQNNELIYNDFETFASRMNNAIFNEIDNINFWGNFQGDDIYGQISLKQNRLFTEINIKKKMNDKTL